MRFGNENDPGIDAGDKASMTNQTARRMDMFKVGQDYKITMIVAGRGGEWTDEYGQWTVAAVDGTLIKLSNPHSKDKIVNTASWHFVSAEPAN
jgi:hypothetical protein